MFYFDLFIIYAMSLLTFALFGWDKHLAFAQRRRIPEWLLFTTSALGGAFGALCGMIFFKHKTQHKNFLLWIPILVTIQLSLDIIFRVFLR